MGYLYQTRSHHDFALVLNTIYSIMHVGSASEAGGAVKHHKNV